MDKGTKKPLVLLILDGWGYSHKNTGNPIERANKPNLDLIQQRYPMTLLQASGLAVGMDWVESGNSEVGHLNIGAGRIIQQYNSRINRDIESGVFLKNQSILGAFKNARDNKSKVHIIGLLTSGTVHASFRHLVALLSAAKENNMPQIYLHLFMDGRDSGLQEGANMLSEVSDEIQKIGVGQIASVIGRDYAMDRDNEWTLTQKTYGLIASGIGEKTEEIETRVKAYYKEEINDPLIPALVSSQANYTGISSGDSLIFFNFREDSMRQLVKPFLEEDFDIFPVRGDISSLYIMSMSQYLENTNLHVAFAPPEIKNSLAEVLSQSGKTQFHIAETEKYAHVAYFFNGIRNQAFDAETDVFVESPKNIIEKPQMACLEITNKTISELKSNFFDFAVINFANADMLAHTGNYNATLKGIEIVDHAIGILKKEVLEMNGTLLITADHGHAEEMIYGMTGNSKTEHSNNPVPFYLVSKNFEKPTAQIIDPDQLEINGILADVAPTILELMSLPQPDEMSGQSLLPDLTK